MLKCSHMLEPDVGVVPSGLRQAFSCTSEKQNTTQLKLQSGWWHMKAWVPSAPLKKLQPLSTGTCLPTHSSIRSLRSLMHDVLPAMDTYERPQQPVLHPSFTSLGHLVYSSSECVSAVCVSRSFPHLTVEEQVQLPVDPLLYIQPPLQVLAVVFDRQLAQLAVCRLFCFVRCLEHHPGLGAWIWRHGCHGLGRTVETHRAVSHTHTRSHTFRLWNLRLVHRPPALSLYLCPCFSTELLFPCVSAVISLNVSCSVSVTLPLALCPRPLPLPSLSLKLTVLLSFPPPLATPTGCTIRRMVMRYAFVSVCVRACVRVFMHLCVHTRTFQGVCLLFALFLCVNAIKRGERVRVHSL